MSFYMNPTDPNAPAAYSSAPAATSSTTTTPAVTGTINHLAMTNLPQTSAITRSAPNHAPILTLCQNPVANRDALLGICRSLRRTNLNQEDATALFSTLCHLLNDYTQKEWWNGHFVMLRAIGFLAERKQIRELTPAQAEQLTESLCDVCKVFIEKKNLLLQLQPLVVHLKLPNLIVEMLKTDDLLEIDVVRKLATTFSQPGIRLTREDREEMFRCVKSSAVDFPLEPNDNFNMDIAAYIRGLGVLARDSQFPNPAPEEMQTLEFFISRLTDSSFTQQQVEEALEGVLLLIKTLSPEHWKHWDKHLAKVFDRAILSPGLLHMLGRESTGGQILQVFAEKTNSPMGKYLASSVLGHLQLIVLQHAAYSGGSSNVDALALHLAGLYLDIPGGEPDKAQLTETLKAFAKDLELVNRDALRPLPAPPLDDVQEVFAWILNGIDLPNKTTECKHLLSGLEILERHGFTACTSKIQSVKELYDSLDNSQKRPHEIISLTGDKQDDVNEPDPKRK